MIPTYSPLAITLDAGVQWFEAYNAVETHKRVLLGGISFGGTVGAAGGWLLGGGHGILSPHYGLGSPKSRHDTSLALFIHCLFRSRQRYRVQHHHFDWQLSHSQLSPILRFVLGFTQWRWWHLWCCDVRDVPNTPSRSNSCGDFPVNLNQFINYEEAPH